MGKSKRNQVDWGQLVGNGALLLGAGIGAALLTRELRMQARALEEIAEEQQLLREQTKSLLASIERLSSAVDDLRAGRQAVPASRRQGAAAEAAASSTKKQATRSGAAKRGASKGDASKPSPSTKTAKTAAPEAERPAEPTGDAEAEDQSENQPADDAL